MGEISFSVLSSSKIHFIDEHFVPLPSLSPFRKHEKALLLIFRPIGGLVICVYISEAIAQYSWNAWQRPTLPHLKMQYHRR